MSTQLSFTDKPAIDSGATFSNDGNHRYSLWRIWDKSLPLVMFIGLNPSTANQTDNDNTIKSVIRLAKHNGYGGFYMMNCWTYISTDPTLIKSNPMADEWNMNNLAMIAKDCQDIVFAWGNFSIVADTGKDQKLLELFPDALTLGKNKNGSPKHPLYIKSSTKLIKFNCKK